jgi:hypothetical protein
MVSDDGISGSPQEPGGSMANINAIRPLPQSIGHISGPRSRLTAISPMSEMSGCFAHASARRSTDDAASALCRKPVYPQADRRLDQGDCGLPQGQVAWPGQGDWSFTFSAARQPGSSAVQKLRCGARGGRFLAMRVAKPGSEGVSPSRFSQWVTVSSLARSIKPGDIRNSAQARCC